MRIVSLLALSFLASCATTPEGAHPDDMSTAGHEEAAEKERTEAKEHTAEYDPNAIFIRRSGGRAGAYPELPDYYFNPTELHLREARTHAEHASAHQHAADFLKGFEEGECKLFEAATRTLCPLLGGIEQVVEIDGGVRFTVREGVDPAGMVAHMRCHFAAGRAAGREGMDECPLYLTNLSIQRSGDRTLELTTSDPSAVKELRRRIREHAAPAPAEPAS